MSNKIAVEMTVDELRTILSVLEGSPRYFKNLASHKPGNGGDARESIMRCLVDRLSLELSKNAS